MTTLQLMSNNGSSEVGKHTRFLLADCWKWLSQADDEIRTHDRSITNRVLYH